MAKYAFRDEQRKEIIYSNEAVKEDRNTAFYCPNTDCNAQLYICAIDGSKAAYFRATKPQHPHIPNCLYGTRSIEFDENQFDESRFDYDKAMESLFGLTDTAIASNKSGEHSIGEPQKHPPRTIRQMYSMCKSLPVKSKYGNKEIGEMLLDDRSEYRYPKGCFGNRIIEATVKKRFYDSEKKQIYLTAPVTSKKYSFVLDFSDNDTYKFIRNEIFNNSDKIIIVGGKWKPTDKYNYFISSVNGRKQVAIIKCFGSLT